MTKICSRYRHGWALCAPECKAREGVWPATLEFFGPCGKDAKDNLQSGCRACSRAYAHSPAAQAYRRSYMRIWRPLHRDNLGRYNARNRAYCQALRHMILAAYGGRCVDCGVVSGRLEMHHMWGRGDPRYPEGPLRDDCYLHLYRAMRKHHEETGKWPDGFEIRCRPCHHRWLLAPYPLDTKPETLFAKKTALEHALREVNAQLVGIA